MRYSAYGILLLIAGATAARCPSPPARAFRAHHEMVALLHQMGALPAFIARAVEWHYFISALLAALLGTVAAALFFLGAGGLEIFGRRGGAVPAAAVAEMDRDSLAFDGARRHRADRLGDGAHIGAIGGQGHLLDLSRKPDLEDAFGINVLLRMMVRWRWLYALGFCLCCSFRDRCPAPADAGADGIVALTGGDARLDAAVALFEKGVGKRLLISGVGLATSRDTLKEMTHGGARFDCCADIGYAAEDTHGNAVEAAEWARAHQFRSLVVVTARYHMPRAMREFSARCPDVGLVPIRWTQAASTCPAGGGTPRPPCSCCTANMSNISGQPVTLSLEGTHDLSRSALLPGLVRGCHLVDGHCFLPVLVPRRATVRMARAGRGRTGGLAFVRHRLAVAGPPPSAAGAGGIQAYEHVGHLGALYGCWTIPPSC